MHQVGVPLILRTAVNADTAMAMDWKDRLLRLFAEGLTDSERRPLDSERVVRTLDRIESDPEIGAELDALGPAELRRAFLRFYEASESTPDRDA